MLLLSTLNERTRQTGSHPVDSWIARTSSEIRERDETVRSYMKCALAMFGWHLRDRVSLGSSGVSSVRKDGL